MRELLFTWAVVPRGERAAVTTLGLWAWFMAVLPLAPLLLVYIFMTAAYFLLYFASELLVPSLFLALYRMPSPYTSISHPQTLCISWRGHFRFSENCAPDVFRHVFGPLDHV